MVKPKQGEARDVPSNISVGGAQGMWKQKLPGLYSSFSQQNLIFISCAHYPCPHRILYADEDSSKYVFFSFFAAEALGGCCTASRPDWTWLNWAVIAQGCVEAPAHTGTTSGIFKPHVRAWTTIPRQGRLVCSTLSRTSDLAFKSTASNSGFTCLLSPVCIWSSLDQMCNWHMGLGT